MTKKLSSQLALNAMCRASIQATERAAGKGLKMPVWKNGEIIFVDAKDRLQSLYFHSVNSSDQ